MNVLHISQVQYCSVLILFSVKLYLENQYLLMVRRQDEIEEDTSGIECDS